VNIKAVIAHLIAKISGHTDLFTDYLDAVIDSVVVLSDKRTVQAETLTAHGLLLGASVIASEGSNFNGIDSITISDGVATIKTTDEHDYNYDALDTQYVTIENSETAWNKQYEVVNVTGRNDVQIATTETVVPTTLGNIRESRSMGVNGIVKISSVVSTTVFQYTISDSAPDVPQGSVEGLKIEKGARIAGAADPERARGIYADTDGRKMWMFVMFSDDTVSKSSHTSSDAVALFDNASEGRLTALNNFDIAVMIPSTSLGAVDEVEQANGEIKNALIGTLFGLRGVETDETDYEYRIVYNGSVTLFYTTALYVRLYSFQIPSDITFRNTDSITPLSVALRDVVLDIAVSDNLNTAKLETEINIDEEE